MALVNSPRRTKTEQEAFRQLLLKTLEQGTMTSAEIALKVRETREVVYQYLATMLGTEVQQAMRSTEANTKKIAHWRLKPK